MNGRGIDTPEERQAIEYQPKITLPRRPAVVTDAPSMSVTSSGSTERPPEWHSSFQAAQALYHVKQRIGDLITYAEQQLARRVVQIDGDSEPHVREAIVRRCPLNQNTDGIIYNDDRINLDMYKRSLVGTSGDDAIIAKRYEQSMKGLDGLAAGEALALLCRLERSCDETLQFLGDLMDLPTGMTENRLEAMSQQEQALQRRQLELESTIGNDPVAQLRLDRQLAEVRAVLDTLSQTAQLIQQQAEALEEWLGRIGLVIKATVGDSFNEMLCCFLRKLLASVQITPELPFDTEAARAEIEQAVGEFTQRVDDSLQEISTIIDKMKVLLAFGMDPLEQAGNYVEDKINEYLHEGMTQVRRVLTETLQRMKASINEPIVQWLDRLVASNQENCLPVEELANLVMNVIEEVEERYSQQLINLCRNDTFAVRLLNQRVENMQQKKMIRDFYQVLDLVQQNLDSIRAWCLNGRLQDWFYEFAKANGLDTYYDMATDTVAKLEQLSCEELLGGY